MILGFEIFQLSRTCQKLGHFIVLCNWEEDLPWEDKSGSMPQLWDEEELAWPGKTNNWRWCIIFAKMIQLLVTPIEAFEAIFKARFARLVIASFRSFQCDFQPSSFILMTKI